VIEVGRARNGPVEIAFERHGEPTGTPLLLVMGLGMQMHFWRDDFVAELLGHGFTVARFDNRDVGESTHLRSRGVPPLAAVMATPRIVASYRLTDMAHDAVAVLDALGWSSAHIVGASLGGMVAQTLAIEHPGRVYSMTSIMSTPSPRFGRPSLGAASAVLRAPAARTADDYAEGLVSRFRVIGSPAYPLDEQWLRAYARRAFARGYDAGGARRQLAAAAASPSRIPGLRRIQVPTLVVHGEADPLVAPSGGKATAAAVLGARLVTYSGMGHDVPSELHTQICHEIAANAGVHGTSR
jgi:pimeloyl-ACP methyl ester carboxylesterase